MISKTSFDQLEATPHANAFPQKEPKIIRLKLEAGESVATHSHPGRDIVLFLLSGEIELRLDGTPHLVEAGDIVHFDGDQDILPTANEYSIALLVLSSKSDLD